ncbi:PREDICTED: uncharacterized protein LOC109188835 [Ipomoea nil]|uniref:uncharacterized protein LOC109188835 n=1 Tax=Ipomoea nil TaxID=35883 RepID=UPI0009018D44|nr:PREDICTED: uncharacterized protein LOC109188835 [Ipomoea nil]
MGENVCEEEEWMLSNLVENEKVTEVEEEEEEEEALSLCDLPNKEENQSKKESPGACGGESQEDVVADDFDFCWWGGSSSFKESEMCAADEVFFQGQILPLRHSISSDGGGSLAGSFKNNGAPRCHSFRYTSGRSSRSSSLRSLRSSSSGSSSTCTTTTTIHSNNSKKQAIIRNQTTPQQVRFSKVVSSSHANVINNNCSSRKSSSITLWTLFRAGLVSTPEIDFQDLKIRQHKPFGSRNNNNNNTNAARVSVKRNLKHRFSHKNIILFGSACSCSVNDVRTVPPRTVGRNSSAKEAPHEDKNSETTKVMRKRSMSRRLRTFEWLKQLSLEGPAATTTTTL